MVISWRWPLEKCPLSGESWTHLAAAGRQTLPSGRDRGRTGRLRGGSSLPCSTDGDSHVSADQILLPPVGPGLCGAQTGPRHPVGDTQWETLSGRRTSRNLRSPLRTFSFLPPAQLCTKLVAFSGDLFGVGKDLEIAFPEAWEANSHLALTAGA